MQYFAIGVCGLGSAIAMAASIASMLRSGEIPTTSSFFALALGLETLVIFAMLRKMSTTQVRLEPGGIRYLTHRKDILIPYDQIEALKQPSIRYTGGWLEIHGMGEKLRLTVVLDGIGELVRELKARLDAHGRDQVYDPDKLFAFYKTACYSEQSWQRLYQFGAPVFAAIFTSLGLGVGMAMLTAKPLMSTLVLWGIGASLLALGYSAVEFLIFARRLAKASDPATFFVPERDPLADKRELRRWMGGLFIAATLCQIAMTGFLVINI
jgi:hypothetical protein